MRQLRDQRDSFRLLAATPKVHGTGLIGTTTNSAPD
jgi:hypothetical protein